MNILRFDYMNIFTNNLLMMWQEDEIKEKSAKIEQAEQRLTTLSLELKVRFGLKLILIVYLDYCLIYVLLFLCIISPPPPV